jgi:rhodanese-related sulfurtransferase
MASKEYLLKYLSAEAAEEQLGVKKKKRRKKKVTAPGGKPRLGGVVLHDENPEWAKAIEEEQEEEDGPQIVELPTEAEKNRPKRREQTAGCHCSSGRVVGAATAAAATMTMTPRHHAVAGGMTATPTATRNESPAGARGTIRTQTRMPAPRGQRKGRERTATAMRLCPGGGGGMPARDRMPVTLTPVHHAVEVVEEVAAAAAAAAAAVVTMQARHGDDRAAAAPPPSARVGVARRADGRYPRQQLLRKAPTTATATTCGCHLARQLGC